MGGRGTWAGPLKRGPHIRSTRRQAAILEMGVEPPHSKLRGFAAREELAELIDGSGRDGNESGVGQDVFFF